jgi:poly(hydroxyalkanoate) depolymerase family esterase
MTRLIPEKMSEATRLTNAGKLAEATALIQRMLRGEATSARASDSSQTIIDAEFQRIDASTDAARANASDGSLARQPAPTSPVSGVDVRARGLTGLGETLRRLAGKAKRGVPRPAPEPIPDGATFETASYANAAGMRDYKLYVPSTSQGQPMPLIVMLHGCTQSPDDFAAGTRMNVHAEADGFLVAYPAQPASANAQKCWNWFNPEDQRRDRGEPALIAGITRQIMRDYPVDPARTYIAGLSAGGAAAAVMAATYPDLYAAVCVHSGLPAGSATDLPSAFAAMRQGGAGGSPRTRFVPTIIFHGDQDATVHPRNADALAAEAVAQETGSRSASEHGRAPGGRPYRRSVRTDASGRVLCEQWTIHGAGHAWSGGSPSGSFTDPQGPDATREMLRFFSEHAGWA